MSIRNVRKLMGDNSLPPPEGNSDEEYEPLYSKKVTNNFKGLEISSHSEEQNDSGEQEIDQIAEMGRKKKKKKKKQRKSKNVQTEASTSKLNTEDLDEIDKSVMEVNAILGEPITIPSESSEVKDPTTYLMVVTAKYLNGAEELNRLFGREEDDSHKRQRQCYKLMKRAIILPPPENNYIIRFNSGLSMSIIRKVNDLTFFTFDHSREYQKILRSLIALYTHWDGPMNWFPEELNGPKALIEEILHKIDTMFYVEEYTIANTMVEQCIAHLQSVVHLSFNVTNIKTRLEYKVRENRVFHILLLKYMYLLTNKACHRTSLEVAKILLNLDPSDPLAVVLIIDTLATRAREYKWLVDAVEVWSKERSAGLLFNIQYSHAMAHFHLIHKSKDGDMSVADRFLQNAIIRFPTVVLKIFEACSLPLDAKITNHPLFKDAGETTKNLQDLINLYARFSWSRWKEASVIKWLRRNVNELIEKFDANMLVKELTDKLANKRQNLFQAWPTEIIRHLTIISPMSKLLVDGAVPHVDRGNSFDPVPPADTIDRYNYRTTTRFEHEPMPNNVLYELFASLIPSYQTPRDPEQDVARPRRRPQVVLEPVQEVDLHQVLEADDVDDALKNNLLNSVGEVRNALMQFLGEWYDGVFQTDVNSLVPIRRQDGENEQA